MTFFEFLRPPGAFGRCLAHMRICARRRTRGYGCCGVAALLVRLDEQGVCTEDEMTVTQPR
ncbi:hypothetical protein IG631_13992 [Alternaria alternata]|nr:hypothetical protein IG631_13992 [Alternaria alternata]